MCGLIEITTSKNNKYYNLFNEIKNNVKAKINFLDIKIKINYVVEDKFLLELIRYDGSVKLSLDTFNFNSFDAIFDTINEMPKYSKQNGGTIDYKSRYIKYKQKYLGLLYYIDHTL
jgi:hypothetical protein